MKYGLILLLFLVAGISNAEQYHIYKGYVTLGAYKKLSDSEQSMYIQGLIDGVLASALFEGIESKNTKPMFECRNKFSKEEVVDKFNDVIHKVDWKDDESMQRIVLYVFSMCGE